MEFSREILIFHGQNLEQIQQVIHQATRTSCMRSSVAHWSRPFTLVQRVPVQFPVDSKN